MKAYKIIVMLIGLCSLFVSCEKNNLEQTINEPSYRKLNQSTVQILNNTKTQEDYKIRQIMLIFGNAFADVFRNQFYVKLVISSAKNSVLREANLKTLVAENPDFKAALNDALSNHMSQTNLKTEGEDVFTYLSDQLIYDTIYIPKIVIPNLSVLNPDKWAITSSGLELDESLDPTLDDDIWAKLLNGADELEDIILNEMEAKTSENPVLIFGNGEYEAKYANSLVFGEDLGNGTSGPTVVGKQNLMKYLTFFLFP